MESVLFYILSLVLTDTKMGIPQERALNFGEAISKGKTGLDGRGYE